MPTSEVKVAASNVGVGQITVQDDFKKEAQCTQFWISAGPILAGNEQHTFWSKHGMLHVGSSTWWWQFLAAAWCSSHDRTKAAAEAQCCNTSVEADSMSA